MLSSKRIVDEGISGIESEGFGAAVDFGNGVKVGVGKEVSAFC
jgi:hypothetical protein